MHEALHRPSDADAFRTAVRHVRTVLGVPFAFGGQTDPELGNGGVRMAAFHGNLTQRLNGVVVNPGAGLGGRILLEGGPAGVDDYARARSISHEYDVPVLAEKVTGIIGVPVTVRGQVRGLLYGAVRGAASLGDRATESLLGVARRLQSELTLRDEVDRRVRLLLADRRLRPAGIVTDSRTLQQLQDLQAELRRIARETTDPRVRDQLRDASEQLTSIGHEQATPAAPKMSPRETDVLVEIALGRSNAQAAEHLGVSSETIKSYLRSAYDKLEVHNRHEAVVAARRLGIVSV